MEKKVLFRFDKVSSISNADESIAVKTKNLTAVIENGKLTQVRCLHPKILTELFLGTIIPISGNVLFAGVNIATRNKNERRIEIISPDMPAGKTAKLLKDALSFDVNYPSVLEAQQCDKKAEIATLKVTARHASADKKNEYAARIKQAQIDNITLGFKIQRRRAELELNLKTAKALLDSVSKDKLTDSTEIYVKKLRAKYFSALYEYSLFSHKMLPHNAVDTRVKAVISELSLPDFFEADNINAALASAYVKAPLMMLYLGVPDEQMLNAFNSFINITGIAIVVVTNKTDQLSCPCLIDIDDKCFVSA